MGKVETAKVAFCRRKISISVTCGRQATRHDLKQRSIVMLMFAKYDSMSRSLFSVRSIRQFTVDVEVVGITSALQRLNFGSRMVRPAEEADEMIYDSSCVRTRHSSALMYISRGIQTQCAELCADLQHGARIPNHLQREHRRPNSSITSTSLAASQLCVGK